MKRNDYRNFLCIFSDSKKFLPYVSELTTQKPPTSIFSTNFIILQIECYNLECYSKYSADSLHFTMNSQ